MIGNAVLQIFLPKKYYQWKLYGGMHESAKYTTFKRQPASEAGRQS